MRFSPPMNFTFQSLGDFSRGFSKTHEERSLVKSAWLSVEKASHFTAVSADGWEFDSHQASQLRREQAPRTERKRSTKKGKTVSTEALVLEWKLAHYEGGTLPTLTAAAVGKLLADGWESKLIAYGVLAERGGK